MVRKGLRLLFVLATEHTLLRKFLNIWRQILFPGDLDDDALLNFCTIKPGTFNCPRGLQLPARLNNYQCIFTQLQGLSNLIVSISQFALEKHFVCFDSNL